MSKSDFVVTKSPRFWRAFPRSFFFLALCATSWTPTALQAAASRYSMIASMPGSLSASSTGALLSPTGLIWHPSGILIGTAWLGGAYGKGGIFTVTPDGTYRTLFDVTPDLGPIEALNQTQNIVSAPTLVLDNQANVLAWTFEGGSADSGGAVFKLTTQGYAGTFYEFGNIQSSTGSSPHIVSLSNDGNFYGLANSGASRFNAGAIFKLTQAGQESVIYTFQGTPPTGFVAAGDGNFYGTRPANSAMQWPDVIFKVTPGGDFSAVHTFDALDANGHNADGSGPDQLMQGADLNFYGSTTAGGSTGGGVIFAMTPGGQYTVLHTFDYLPGSTGGVQPRSLFMAQDGNLYGVTLHGGASQGTVFRLSPSGIFTTLHTLDGGGREGAGPVSMVASAQPRVFYGITYGGGSNSGGSVFKLVVPVKNDIAGTGISNIIAYDRNGAFVTGLPAHDGTVLTATRTVAAGYYPVATGDFNGDGIADVLWTSANHDLYIWFGKPDGYTAAYAGTYPQGWSPIGTGDMDGDGKDDIAWINASKNQIAYWFMNGAVRKGAITKSYTPGYFPVALGDFDGDGKTDILWTSANRDLWVWSSTGSGFTSRYVSTYPAGWHVSGVADINGDGIDDLVWKDDTTKWGYWLMKGASAPVVVPLVVPDALAAYGMAAIADYNGDGVADVLWSDGTHLAVTFNQGECNRTAGPCTFSLVALPMTVSSGQQVLNSGLVPSN